MWARHETDYFSFQSEKGLATIEPLEDGRWRWEGFPNDSDFDMDGWWGICSSAEEAKAEAEKYLGT